MVWPVIGGLAAAIAIAMAFFLFWRKQALPAFDSARAYSLLERQCAFGPRVPGTEAHGQCRAFLVNELQQHADRVSEQTFSHFVAALNREVTLTNIIAAFNLNAGKRALLCAHWDSRPWADQDPDSSMHQTPVAGANDGASGVAILLEVSRLLRLHPPDVGVDIILFDGEDLGISGQSRSFALGSQHFAQNKDKRYNPMFGLLLDMVGDRSLEIYQEANSWRYASGLTQEVWDKASDLGISEFIPRVQHEVFDDHVPLIETGIPMVNLIDFDYPHWHTTEDTPDKCSAESLDKVGRVVLAMVYR